MLRDGNATLWASYFSIEQENILEGKYNEHAWFLVANVYFGLKVYLFKRNSIITLNSNILLQIAAFQLKTKHALCDPEAIT